MPDSDQPKEVPVEYCLDNIEREIQESIQRFPTNARNYEGLDSLGRFMMFSNNFTGTIRTATTMLNDDGTTKVYDANPDNQKWKEDLVRKLHLQEIHEIIRTLGYSLDVLRNTRQGEKKSDELWEMIRNIWIEMRKRGFSSTELKG